MYVAESIALYVYILSQVRAANLLGVVGTDVSIDQIKKLVPPYKVNKIPNYIKFERLKKFILFL